MKKKYFSYIYISILIVFILSILGIFIYGGYSGWFKINLSSNTIINQETISQLENPLSGSCYASIYPTTITSGDLVTGTITTNPNTFCEVYGTDGTIWRKIAEGTTDFQGKLIFSDNFAVVGTFNFRAICGDCITNQVSLKVNPGISHSCTDSDGKNKLTPGHAIYDTISYYDKCINTNSVKEYYCNGNILAEQNIACDIGYSCYETRSGGYCKLNTPAYTCTDSDGKDNFLVSGNCQDSYHNLGYSDYCDGNYAYDYYCDSDGICQKTSRSSPCYCYGGACLSCSSIPKPISQATCNLGICETGTCTFIPATLVNPARCGC